jgi:hypothetical protein
MNPLQQIEQQVLAEGREWTRRRLEEQLQQQADAMPAVCPSSGEALRDTRWRPFELDTVVGTVTIRARYGYSQAQKRWMCPARATWALEKYQRLSPELQQRLCYTATQVSSYERAAAMARCWGSPVSDDRIHVHVRRQGTAALELTLPAEKPSPAEPEFSLVIMMDGWMARERGPDWGASQKTRDACRVAWHEIKSAVIYRLDQRAEKQSGRALLVEKFVVACPPETEPVDFGAAVHAEAMRRGLGRAKTVYVVIDGAVWLWHVAQDRFATAVKTLDFQHASEHLRAVGQALHGEGSEASRAWVEKHLHDLRHGKELRVVRRLEELLEDGQKRSKQTEAVIEREVSYLSGHREHMHYAAMEKAGAPLGSGAMESQNSQWQRRFKTCGQFWRRGGLTSLLALSVLFQNGDQTHLWN